MEASSDHGTSDGRVPEMWEAALGTRGSQKLVQDGPLDSEESLRNRPAQGQRPFPSPVLPWHSTQSTRKYFELRDVSNLMSHHTEHCRKGVEAATL